MNKRITKPHYEKKGENIISKRSKKVDAKKVIPELNKLIKKGREIEERFKLRRNEAIL